MVDIYIQLKKLSLNPDKIKEQEALKKEMTNFKEQIADPKFEGYCHCMLY